MKTEPAAGANGVRLRRFTLRERRGYELLSHLRAEGVHEGYVRYVVEDLGVCNEEIAAQLLEAGYSQAINSLRHGPPGRRIGRDALERLVRREIDRAFGTMAVAVPQRQ